MRSAMLWPFVLSGCTLVVGSDPHVDADAAIDAEVDDVASSPPDAGTPDIANVSDAKACDASACNAAKETCKKGCAETAKKCNDACNDHDGKSCHDLCGQQQQACNGACLVTCLQCVMGCGTCGP